MRKLTKALHEIGAVGVMGELAACVVLVMTAPATAPIEFSAMRHSIVMVDKFVYLPALALSMISGLIAIAATHAYKDAGWAWMKALAGVSMFEGSLLTIVGPAKRAAAVSAQALTGAGDPTAFARGVVRYVGDAGPVDRQRRIGRLAPSVQPAPGVLTVGGDSPTLAPCPSCLNTRSRSSSRSSSTCHSDIGAAA